MKIGYVFGLALVVSTAACSGGDSTPVTPETTASASASSVPPPADSPSAPVASQAPSASASAAPAKAPEPGPDLEIVPMKMSLAKGASIELKADGTLWGVKGTKSLQIGQVSKNTVIFTEGKGSTISVWKDKTVTIPDADAKNIAFDEKDALVVPESVTISIDDKGKVNLAKPDGSKAPDGPTFTGFQPKGRRVAELMTVLFLLTAPAGEPTSSAPGKPGPPAPAPTPAPKH